MGQITLKERYTPDIDGKQPIAFKIEVNGNSESGQATVDMHLVVKNNNLDFSQLDTYGQAFVEAKTMTENMMKSHGLVLLAENQGGEV